MTSARQNRLDGLRTSGASGVVVGSKRFTTRPSGAARTSRSSTARPRRREARQIGRVRAPLGRRIEAVDGQRRRSESSAAAATASKVGLAVPDRVGQPGDRPGCRTSYRTVPHAVRRTAGTQLAKVSADAGPHPAPGRAGAGHARRWTIKRRPGCHGNPLAQVLVVCHDRLSRLVAGRNTEAAMPEVTVETS